MICYILSLFTSFQKMFLKINVIEQDRLLPVQNYTFNFKEENYLLTLPFCLNVEENSIKYFIHNNIPRKLVTKALRRPRYFDFNTNYCFYFNKKLVYFYNGCLLELEPIIINGTVIVKKILFCITIRNTHLIIFLKNQQLFKDISSSILEQGTFFIDPCMHTKEYTKIKRLLSTELNFCMDNFLEIVTISNIENFVFKKSSIFVAPPMKTISEKKAFYEEMFIEVGLKDKTSENLVEIEKKEVVSEEYLKFLNEFQDE